MNQQFPQQQAMPQYTPEQIAAFNAQFAQAQTQPVVYSTETIDDLFDDAEAEMASKGKPQNGTYNIRLIDTKWHISAEEKLRGNLGPHSGMPRLEFAYTDGPRAGKKYTKHFWLGTSHKPDGRTFKGETDWIQFLIKHGFNRQMIKQMEVLDPMTGVRNKQASYAGIMSYLKNEGRDYTVEFYTNKNDATKQGERFGPIPVLFDEQGNPVAKAPVQLFPTAQPAAPVAQVPVQPVLPAMPVPAQAMPVAMPAMQMPIPAQAPVIPVAEIPVAQPVIPVMPVPQAMPAMQMPVPTMEMPVPQMAIPQMAPAPQTIPGLPFGIGGLPQQ